MLKETSATASITLSFFGFITIFTYCSLVNGIYMIQDDYNISNFANMFTFFTQADPTNGFVNYVNQTNAENENLFDIQDNLIYLRVDSLNISNNGRNSLRLTSIQAYNHGLVILDLAHAPGGQCGTWPAYWMLGPDWPANGELDIIEGVNSATMNILTLHTDDGCSISETGNFTATINTTNCDINAPGQAINQGCSMQATDESTYGIGFNSIGGGVYATEWTSQAITIWFFPRADVPADITNDSPDPTSWGPAQASFSGFCDIDEHVRDMQIVFDITFCGDWAGAQWNNDPTCAQKAATCESYVQNNPSDFSDTFWAINGLKVYQDVGTQIESLLKTSDTTADLPTASNTSFISVNETVTATFPFGPKNSWSKDLTQFSTGLDRWAMWPEVP